MNLWGMGTIVWFVDGEEGFVWIELDHGYTQFLGLFFFFFVT